MILVLPHCLCTKMLGYVVIQYPCLQPVTSGCPSQLRDIAFFMHIYNHYINIYCCGWITSGMTDAYGAGSSQMAANFRHDQLGELLPRSAVPRHWQVVPLQTAWLAHDQKHHEERCHPGICKNWLVLLITSIESIAWGNLLGTYHEIWISPVVPCRILNLFYILASTQHEPVMSRTWRFHNNIVPAESSIQIQK